MIWVFVDFIYYLGERSYFIFLQISPDFDINFRPIKIVLGKTNFQMFPRKVPRFCL